MTGQEWLECANLQEMLECVRGKASERKLRLFACACCYSIWRHIADIERRQAIESAEKYADGAVSDEDFTTAVNIAWRVVPRWSYNSAKGRAISAVSWATNRSAWKAATEGAYFAGRAWIRANRQKKDIAEKRNDWWKLCCNLIRDIIGNPFRRLPVDPSWLAWGNGTASKIAQAIYEERRFADLPILADALEEAGCTNADILNHCRSEEPHVRGCWVVDLILGKQ